MSMIALPALSNQGGLRGYLQQVRRFPMLSAEEEFMLAKRWQEHGDVSAAHRLVTSHLRLVIKIASGFKGYGLPLGELVAEGNIGLMQAVKRFDPDRGFRLATYAMWWIKAAMQEFVLRSWSLVKIGSSATQKRLFFNLRKLKNRIQSAHEGDLHPEEAQAIANQLNVTTEEVIDMDRRLSAHDKYLHDPVGEEGGGEFIDLLPEPSANQEARMAENQEYTLRRTKFLAAMETLNARERAILMARRMQEEPVTLEELSQEYGISRERVRQIEAKAMEKLQQHVKNAA